MFDEFQGKRRNLEVGEIRDMSNMSMIFVIISITFGDSDFIVSIPSIVGENIPHMRYQQTYHRVGGQKLDSTPMKRF